jgi:glycerol-1-phosphate dehydrogenase [NAD(P)+]
MLTPVTSVPIPAILEINNGGIGRLGEILQKHQFNHSLLIYDEFTYQSFHAQIELALLNHKVEVLVLSADMDIQSLIDTAFSIPECDVILSIGGGSIIDYGKYIAFLRRLPFISIPTSASNDGFASSNCSIIINGKKTTVPAKIPYGIIADLNIIQSAPKRFILAGIGDLMSNITALYDWEYEENHGKGQINAFALMLSKKAVNSFIRTPMTDIHSPILLKELISSATMGGISTAISGNSSPISGSEHLISHALDKIADQPEMHGIQVGIATYIMAHVQEHRAERISKVLERTGFFSYVKELGLNKHNWTEAIRLAPSIKPNRYTYLHNEQYLSAALKFIEKDPLLQMLWR